MASLLFAGQYGKYADHTAGYRPMCIIVPNGAVFGQWVDAIWMRLRDLHLIISNDDKPSETKFLNNWVSSTAMREAPKSLDNWPERLKYDFDTKDPRAAMTVFVTPYDTHKDRTVDTAYKIPHHKPLQNDILGTIVGPIPNANRDWAIEDP
ncbi:hypothetical protein JMJ35_002124 [Cladonia borealis]|uniref:SNF2 N-terminal domain-containing protein n=1 Tax=Cladonia borealis TaxID=184061 RepID=A0AA39V9N8_9LECA|nr:hypothetical protein JMJ35_002124 [Cladonia borealis]